MLPASFKRSPLVSVFLDRSLPARSTMLRRDTLARAVASSGSAPFESRTTLMVKIECERDEAPFKRVEKTCLLTCPFW